MKKQLPLTKLFVLLITLFLSQTSKAQVIPVDIVERVNNSDDIFEGEVIRSTSYWNHDSTFIFTSSTIQIYKIFKGSIDCGTIEVITDGGRVSNKELDISHNLTLLQGAKGIFLCKQTAKELPVVDYYPENNPLKLDFPYGIEAYIKYYDDGVNPAVADWQFQLDSLAQVYDLLDLYAQLNYTNCMKGGIIIHEHKATERRRHNNSIASSKPYLKKSPPPITLLQPRKNSPQRLLSTADLTYDLLNPNLTDSIPRKFDFDIALSDNLDTGYFLQSYCVIDYDTTIFGTDIYSNNRVRVTRAGFMSDSTSYRAPIFFDASYSNHKLVIVFTADTITNYYVNLPNSPTLAAHISIDMVSCDLSGQVKLADPTEYLTGGHLWADSAGCLGCGRLYDNVNWATNLFVPSCHMLIRNIIPTTVHGGTGDLVHVSGNFFESQQGNIFLGNADDGDSSFAILDSTDIYSWNDTLIEFFVPSIVDENTSINPGPNTPGSGEMVFQNYLGDTSHFNKLTIDYSISNEKYDSIFAGKHMKRLIGATDVNLSGRYGYVLHVDSSVTNYPDLYGCVQKAIHDWLCLTHIEMEEGSNFTLADSDSTAKPYNGSIIQFGTASSINVVTSTYSWMEIDTANCDFPYVFAVDMVINKRLRQHFFADTTLTDKPVGKLDFYANMLHELGHAHSQAHINDSTATMWWFLDTLYTPALQRKIFLENDYSAYDAGQYVLNKGISFAGFTCSENLMNPDTFCSIHPYVEEINKPDIGLIIYPNIVSDKLTLKYNLDKPSATKINIFDYTGRLIYVEEYRNELGEKHHQLNLESLSQGFYFIAVQLDKYLYSAKFIKQ